MFNEGEISSKLCNGMASVFTAVAVFLFSLVSNNCVLTFYVLGCLWICVFLRKMTTAIPLPRSLLEFSVSEALQNEYDLGHIIF